MTIAAGFRCQHCLVLCADTEVTLGADLKLARGKVIYYEGELVKLAFVGAGHSDFIQMASQKVINRLSGPMTHYEIELAIEEVILEVYSKHVRFYPEGPEKADFSLLIGCWTKDEGLELFKTSGSTINTATWSECLGWGAALGSYLSDKLFSPLLTAEEGIGLAVHILQQAKTYVPYCGKGSTVFVIYSDGILKQASATDIVAQEEYFGEFEKLSNNLLLSGYVDEKDQDFKEKLDYFCEQLNALRTKHKVDKERRRRASDMFFGRLGRK